MVPVPQRLRQAIWGFLESQDLLPDAAFGSASAPVIELAQDADDGSDRVVVKRADGVEMAEIYSDGADTVINPLTGDVSVPGAVSVGEVNNDNYVEPQATSSESTSYNADLSTANYHKVTMTGDVTFDFTNAAASEVNSLVLHLVQDGTGSRTPSFTPTVVWDGGSAPSWSTGANEEDIVTFVHDQDGSQWLGFLGGIGFA